MSIIENGLDSLELLESWIRDSKEAYIKEGKISIRTKAGDSTATAKIIMLPFHKIENVINLLGMTLLIHIEQIERLQRKLADTAKIELSQPEETPVEVPVDVETPFVHLRDVNDIPVILSQKDDIILYCKALMQRTNEAHNIEEQIFNDFWEERKTLLSESTSEKEKEAAARKIIQCEEEKYTRYAVLFFPEDRQE